MKDSINKWLRSLAVLPIFFTVLKLLLHFLTNTNYHLHRDEFLYYDEGQHLAWGYFEVPPLTPFLGSLASLLGGSVFSIRLFPALAGAIIVGLACHLAIQLGAKKWGVIFTGTALCLSPTLLGTNTLFQPVSFNQLMWFLIAYTVVRQIQAPQKNRWYYLGLWIGLGILTKYSLAFYLIGLLVAILFTPQRKLLWTRHFLASILIAFLIAAPNLWWQYQHNFPVLLHMEALQESQLVHIDWAHYLSGQIRNHYGFLFVWIAGLVGLFSIERLKPYRSLGLALILTILLIGILQGKTYYTKGAFLILFPFGGITLAHYLKWSALRYGSIALMLLISLPFYPLAFPLLKVDRLKSYVGYLSENYGINSMLRWEDGQYYDLPQDIADMHGWEELVEKVAKIYHELPASAQKQCMLYGGSYGHAGAINYFRNKYQLPEAYSMNGSYMFWANPNASFEHQILVDDVRQNGSQWFSTMELRDSIEHANARDPGWIYWRTDAKIDVEKAWYDYVTEQRAELGIE